jgi:hypothetical protein
MPRVRDDPPPMPADWTWETMWLIWELKDEDGMDAAEIVDHCWNLCRLTEEWVAWVLWQRNHLKRRWFEGRLDKKGRGGKY